MRIFVQSFLALAALCLYAVGFAYLMDAAIMQPIMLDPETPIYHVRPIAEWLAYICLGGAVYVTLSMGGKR